MNAYVTVDPDGKLMLGSMVTVEQDGAIEAFNEVPAACSDHNLTLFWHRVVEALREVGWTVDGVGPDYGWVRDGDVIRFNAKPKEN